MTEKIQHCIAIQNLNEYVKILDLPNGSISVHNLKLDAPTSLAKDISACIKKVKTGNLKYAIMGFSKNAVDEFKGTQAISSYSVLIDITKQIQNR